MPEGLAAMPAGAGLAVALHAVPLGGVPNDRMLELARAQYRQLCHEQAQMAAVLVELSRCTTIPGPGEVARADTPGRYAPAETRAALRWTRYTADVEHGVSESVIYGMPEVFAAWLAGDIDRARVNLFDRYLTGLTREQIAAICGAAVPRAPQLTTGQLAGLLRRMVIAIDPDAASRWYRKGINGRDVTAYVAEDGTVTVSANGLPADEAAAACERVQQWAAAAKRAGHPGRIGQIRGDLFLGLLDGRFHGMTREQVIAALIAGYRLSGPAGPNPTATDGAAGGDPTADSDTDGDTDGDTDDTECDDADRSSGPDYSGPDDDGPDDGGSGGSGSGPGGGAAAEGLGDQRVGIEIRVGLATLLGLDEHPAEIPGLGLLVAPDARLRVAVQGRAEWRFAVTDTDGTLLSEGRTRRRPAGVRGDGPPGGIVELHIPETLLHELVADPPSCGVWAAVVADIAVQHADRDRHLADLDARPGDRLPGAALRRHTEIRDRTCTFAGVCRHPAHTGEIDHSRDRQAGGATVRINLGPLCPHDHGVKHGAGWTVTQPQPGTFVWCSPLGGRYVTRGEFLTPELPEPAPADPGPWNDVPARTIDGPSLSRPPPRAPPPPAAHGREYPDEPPF